MSWVLKEAGGQKRYYGGDPVGWIENPPADPPPPVDQAKRFATREEAEAFALSHSMKAAAEQVAG